MLKWKWLAVAQWRSACISVAYGSGSGRENDMKRRNEAISSGAGESCEMKSKRNGEEMKGEMK